MARGLLYKILQVAPKADFFQGVVEPPSGDAEIGLVGRDVVDAMVLPGQDDMKILEDGDVSRQAEVCVRPFVDLE